MTDSQDIGVLGSGPAALAMASALISLGAKVTLIAPEPERAWEPNYCLWSDEVPPGMEGLAERFWPEVTVATSLGVQNLQRPYVKLDTPALQAFFWKHLDAPNVTVEQGRALRLDHDARGTTIQLDDGSSRRVRVVVDASGGRSRFVERVHGRAPAFQIAYGLLLDAPGHDFNPQRMVLMDFRPATPDSIEPASFLYALPLSDGRLFVEETSLARRPAVPLELLRVRLESRLASLGLERCARLAEEHCAIPMGLGLPKPVQRVVPFGAAASMVHPSSGYMISQILRKADPVAESILAGLDTGDVSEVAATAIGTLWPRSQRSVWEIYGLGLEAIVAMGTEETTRFFDGFFRLSLEDWSGFLSGTIPPSRLAGVMTRLFRGLPASTRWNLLRTSLSTGAAPLARSVLQPGTR
ncbi:MAG: lycopene cyclase family protein [Polyangiales bacterium]